MTMATIAVPRALLEKARMKDRRSADVLMETFVTSAMPVDVLIERLEIIAGE